MTRRSLLLAALVIVPTGYLLGYYLVRVNHELVRYESNCIARAGLHRDFWQWEYACADLRRYVRSSDMLGFGPMGEPLLSAHRRRGTRPRVSPPAPGCLRPAADATAAASPDAAPDVPPVVVPWGGGPCSLDAGCVSGGPELRGFVLFVHGAVAERRGPGSRVVSHGKAVGHGCGDVLPGP